jgi:hypothetical protein
MHLDSHRSRVARQDRYRHRSTRNFPKVFSLIEKLGSRAASIANANKGVKKQEQRSTEAPEENKQ